MSLFSLGSIEISPAAAGALAAVGADAEVFLTRHQHGDWGEEAEEIQQENAFAVQHLQVILSTYRLSDETPLLVMTTADRSRTYIFLSEELRYRTVEVSLQEGYALWSKLYDQGNNALIVVEEPRVDELLAALPMTVALDVGTGTGRYALKLARRGVKVTAIDQSEEMLAIARQTASSEGLAIDFQRESLGDALPFTPHQFDFLICALTLCHVPNLAQAMQEFARVLQDDGYLLITAFHPNAIERGWRTDFRKSGRRYVLPNMPHTRSDYLEALAAAGFAVLHVIDVALRAVPDGYLPEALMRESGDKLLCLIVLARKQ